MLPPISMKTGKKPPIDSPTKKIANEALMGPKISVKNNSKNIIPTPNGKSEKIAPTILDFNPIN